MLDEVENKWLEAALDATNEVATTVLGYEKMAIVDDVGTVASTEFTGAYIPLVTGNNSLHIGLASCKNGCQAFTRALFGMKDEEDDAPESDVADALGEIVNIVAGGIQIRLAEALPTIHLGLPIFVRGCIQAMRKQRAVVANVVLGEFHAELVLLRNGQVSGGTA